MLEMILVPTRHMVNFKFYEKKKLCMWNTCIHICTLSDCKQSFLGNALMKVGSSQQKLGQTEREFVRAAANNFIQPLQAFLDGDMKTVQVICSYLKNSYFLTLKNYFAY